MSEDADWLPTGNPPELFLATGYDWWRGMKSSVIGCLLFVILLSVWVCLILLGDTELNTLGN